MSTTIRRILFTTADQVAFARRLCESLAEGDAGKGMFSCPLSPTGDDPATHYVCEGHISAEFAGALSDPAILHYACTQHPDLQDVTLEQCQALLAASIVSDGTYQAEVDGQPVTHAEDVHGFIARQGLRVVQAPTEI